MNETRLNADQASSQIDEETRRVCAVLETVASRFPANSPENLAIRDAAIAYHVVKLDRRMRKSLATLRAACGGVLTDEINARLRQRGIEPDDFDEESTAE